MTYHTYIKLLYVHGKLEPNSERLIPSSTRYNWKGYDFSKVYGVCGDKDFDKKLMVGMEVASRRKLYQVNRAVIQLIGLWNVFLSSVKGKKELMNRCSRKLVEVVMGLPKTWSVNRFLSRLNISKQQYDYWKRTFRKCGSSIRSL